MDAHYKKVRFWNAWIPCRDKKFDELPQFPSMTVSPVVVQPPVTQTLFAATPQHETAEVEILGAEIEGVEGRTPFDHALCRW